MSLFLKTGEKGTANVRLKKSFWTFFCKKSFSFFLKLKTRIEEKEEMGFGFGWDQQGFICSVDGLNEF